MHGTWAYNHQQSIILTISAGANLISRIGDDFLSLIAERQIAQHLRRCGKHLKFKHSAVYNAADANLIFPSWHIRNHQRILTFIHGLTDGTKLFRRVQLLLHLTALLGNHYLSQE